MRPSKPVIVCDIDDVVFPFIPGMAAHYNERFGGELTPEDFVSFQLSDVWGGTQEEANSVVESFLGGDTLHLTPLEGVVEAFERLKQDFDIVLVTARNGMFEEKTTVWLRAHLPDLFSQVIFAGNPYHGDGYRSKGDICRELNAVLIIDDYPGNVTSALDHGVEGILYGDKRWTMQGAAEHPEIKHCFNWDEVLEYIYGQWRTKQLS